MNYTDMEEKDKSLSFSAKIKNIIVNLKKTYNTENIKKKIKSSRTIILIMIILAIIIVFIFTWLIVDRYVLDNKENSIKEEKPRIPNSNEIIGRWEGISESINGKNTTELKEYWIKFNQDGTFSGVTKGVSSSGTYYYNQNTGEIKIYDHDVEFEIIGTILIQSNKLIIEYPVYKMKIIYISEK